MSYNEWLEIDLLEDYLDGKLDAKAMHQVERLSLEDPFVAQALAGLSESRSRAQSLSSLQKQLKERIAQKPVEKKRWVITSQRLSIGSAAAVLFIAVSILFWMKGSKHQELLATGPAKKVDVIIAPQATIIEPTAETETNIKSLGNKVVALKAPRNPNLNSTPSAPNAPAVQAAESNISSAPPVARLGLKEEVAVKADEIIIASTMKAKTQVARSAVMALPGKADGVVAGYLSGKVISKENGLPIPGAIVKIEGVDRGTTTDRNGEFRLVADSSQNQKLTVGYLGFTTAEVGVKSNQTVNIVLENESNSLSEVAIVAVPVTNASPLGGWDNYQKYLKANNKLAKTEIRSQEVELDFRVKKDGAVADIKVAKSEGTLIDKEAIRLLKDGPKWIFVPGQQNLGKLKIRF